MEYKLKHINDHSLCFIHYIGLSVNIHQLKILYILN